MKNADDLKIIEIKKVSVKGQVYSLKDQELKLEEIIKVKDKEVEIFREVVRTIEKLKKIEKGKASGEDLKQARQIGESAGKLGFDLGDLEAIENAEKKIKEDKDKGRLLILDEKEAEFLQKTTYLLENNLYKAAKIVTKMSENGDLDTFLESIK